MTPQTNQNEQITDVQNQKICFVISPIGKKDSDVRVKADALLSVVELVLDKYKFKIIRADHGTESTPITPYILNLILNSDLCIVDLTGQNPNVIYEFGIRHGTGKPVIVMCAEGQDLFWDVKDTRTIFYNLDTGNGVIEAQKQCDQFVKTYEQRGYISDSNEISLSYLKEILDSIESKVSRLNITQPAGASNFTPSGYDARQANRDPRKAFWDLTKQGDFGSAAKILPRLEKTFGHTKVYIDALTEIVMADDTLAIGKLVEILQQEGKDLEWTAFKTAIEEFIQFCIANDKQDYGISVLPGVINTRIEDGKLSSAQKANILNQLQRLMYSGRRYEEALAIQLNVIKYDANTPVYIYNLSIIYEELKMMTESIESVDKYMELDLSTDSGDYVIRAIRVYLNSKTPTKALVKKARNAYQILTGVYPGYVSQLTDEQKTALAV